ncbi:maleylpyruvate isomerase family mycothiol-dependent enzyme [Modestobacter sp. I12A-02628]|uniref:Maleylpyruvate isomerase family mycothiol-dependent enzyme n=1 Tax=Goekera deserti TaxID=2497753 RepID=A0A7K3W910_9ACTN|nr:maleylpyruvate isomerase family mycothiol-dependent enzyme [Goekera deserti]MPQ98651.1 maleylpyruvate isomerase family mycothiol-dependent enzyme [Goekera deserti]NDI49213.1 maleylpyruvate isomerase family mycothiol-dependent enzyme [Goekera deserti]NEL52951.1 maleylpyruvate isomerase family mycothiol-dependent enzyme [Goekera deserti]
MSLDPLSVCAAEANILATLLATSDLTAPVPSCPGWSLADLGRHTGGVHAWARDAVGHEPGTPPGAEPPGPAEDATVAAWYRTQADDLLTALVAVDPGRPCWTLDRADRTAGFWLRRQAHETTMHRWDAERAVGRDAHIDPTVALDGIDEVLRMFLPRQLRLGRTSATEDTVHLRPQEMATSHSVGNGAASVGTVSGPAEALLLLLWRRTTLDDPRLTVSGDRSAVDACLDRPLTP